jgi:hypothetical protein
MKALTVFLMLSLFAAATLILVYENDLQKLKNDYQAYTKLPMLEDFPELTRSNRP